jgi:hypothetical protein
MSSIPDDAIIDLGSINDTLRGINAAAVGELAHILKLSDRLSIAEAVRLGSWEAIRPGCQKAMKPGGNANLFA